MTTYEYAVVPAPQKARKAPGLKTTQDRFANAIQTVMNEYGANGWEYVRSDTLPCTERQGLMGRATTVHNVLVFRKPVVVSDTAAPVVVAPQVGHDAADAPAPTVTAQPLDEDSARNEPRLAAE